MTGVLAVAAPAVGAALGGVYLAFDVAVLPALRRVAAPVGGSVRGADDAGAVAADVMRRINVAIVRPSFLVVLFGAPALAVAAAVVEPGPLTIGAAVLQVAGLVVTMAVNVPLNEALARDEAPGAWERFVGRWTRAHRIRTTATLLGATAGAVGIGLGLG